MNKIYKVIWSKTRNCYVAVAEFVKRSGKGGSVLNRRHIAAALAAVAICAAPTGALANSGGYWDGGKYIGDMPEYKVIIDKYTLGDVYGRFEFGSTTATGASVTVKSGTVGNERSWNDVYGGYSPDGSAENNTVTISGGKVTGDVVGGVSINGMAGGDKPEDGNHITLSGGSVGGRIYGGRSNNGKAKYNSVTIADGIAEDVVCGGYSESHIATYNTVTITGGTVNQNVYGGWSEALFQLVAKIR